ncbi:MAG: nickel pincer cofactor biosynthesis protein LarB [Lachnospirales bacterium]
MNRNDLKLLLEEVSKGNISVDNALEKISVRDFCDLGYAKPDFTREVRQGVPEVIFGEGKTSEQIVGILKKLREKTSSPIIITRINKEKANLCKKEIDINYYEIGNIAIAGKFPDKKTGNILVITAGTSDINVAEEAAITAGILGNNVKRIYDVGVAGIHRLLSYEEDIKNARVIIAIAGMEGALASVIGGLCSCPVIAVPTSVGYGASFKGLAALLSMLNSCASGVSVVNIDNGFGAGFIASRINKMEGV